MRSDEVIIFKEIKAITSSLIEAGLSVQQNFPTLSNGIIAYQGMSDLSIALKDIEYNLIYEELEKTKNYNFKLIDGALVQILYTFRKGTLVSHRLAFFSSPNLINFEENPDIYDLDEIYGDIFTKRNVTFPLRFDYDASPKKFIELDHPYSHLTLGQYKNCRIAASEPITPETFMTFILKSFYNSAFRKNSSKFNFNSGLIFKKTITNKEQKMLHIGRY